MCMSQNYTPTEWIDNRTVGTASVMNNMEKGIEDAHNRIDGVDSQIKEKATKTFINVKEFGAKGDGLVPLGEQPVQPCTISRSSFKASFTFWISLR